MRSTGISRRLVAGSRYNASVASRAASVNLSERTARARGSLRQASRSEEHTSELQSQSNLVCRLLLEKKKSTTGRYWSAGPTLNVGETRVALRTRAQLSAQHRYPAPDWTSGVSNSHIMQATLVSPCC